MSDVHERPQGANAADPSTPRPPWRPSDPARWAILGMGDPPPNDAFPRKGHTADLLAYALTLPGAEDPVSGIVSSVIVELLAFSDLFQESKGDVLLMLARRLQVAMVLLARTDNRAPMPMEDEEEPPPVEPTEPPAAPDELPVDPDDVEVTRDAGPDVPHRG
jgi:hypothetical protein